MPAALVALASTPAVAAAPPATGGAPMPAPRTAATPSITEPPATGPALSPVVADVRAIPGLSATLVSPTAYDAGATPATLNVTNTAAAAVTLNVALVRVGHRRRGASAGRRSPSPRARRSRSPGTGASARPSRPGRHGSSSRCGPRRLRAPRSPPSSRRRRCWPTPSSCGRTPIRCRVAHDYGIGGNGRFGTGRAGHMHQGQDVFAACGTPVLAARAGTVQFEEFQSAAGNYVVIDGDGTAQDTAYMHLRDPALPAEGEHVGTGQLIGYAGDTGDATECHLHFEIWDAPGWYEGGQPVDPLPFLQALGRLIRRAMAPRPAIIMSRPKAKRSSPSPEKSSSSMPVIVGKRSAGSERKYCSMSR